MDRLYPGSGPSAAVGPRVGPVGRCGAAGRAPVPGPCPRSWAVPPFLGRTYAVARPCREPCSLPDTLCPTGSPRRASGGPPSVEMLGPGYLPTAGSLVVWPWGVAVGRKVFQTEHRVGVGHPSRALAMRPGPGTLPGAGRCDRGLGTATAAWGRPPLAPSRAVAHGWPLAWPGPGTTARAQARPGQGTTAARGHGHWHTPPPYVIRPVTYVIRRVDSPEGPRVPCPRRRGPLTPHTTRH